MIAGAGLVFFEVAELGWIGFQPLEAVFAAVGVSVVGLAWRLPRTGLQRRLPAARNKAR